MNRKLILRVGWLPLLAFFLAACVRSASSPSPTLEFAAEQPSPTPDQVSFPLEPASTWIYEYRAYVEDEQALWVVTETILSVEKRDRLLLAEVERMASLQEGQPSAEFFLLPETGTSWYILRGGDLFQQSETLAPDDLSKNTRHEMVFPPESVPCWPVDDAFGPLEQGASGCRYVSQALATYTTPAGEFENCLELVTPYLSGAVISVYCPNVGFVAEKHDHNGTPFGYELVLTGYSLPFP